MNAPHHLPLFERPAAIAQLGERIAEQAGIAIAAGRDPSLAIASRVGMAELGEALDAVFESRTDIRARLHLFPSDLCFSGPCDRREEMRRLVSRLRMPARQLHLPAEGGDVLRAARAFESDVRGHFRLLAGEVPAFDALCLAPADLVAPRHADASDRLVTGVYHAATGRCSVALTVASLVGARAVFSFGPEGKASDAPRWPASLASRAQRLHWPGSPGQDSIHASEGNHDH